MLFYLHIFCLKHTLRDLQANTVKQPYAQIQKHTSTHSHKHAHTQIHTLKHTAPHIHTQTHKNRHVQRHRTCFAVDNMTFEKVKVQLTHLHSPCFLPMVTASIRSSLVLLSHYVLWLTIYISSSELDHVIDIV